MIRVCLFLIGVLWFHEHSSASQRYNVADGDWNDTSNWATTSGGSPGASVPGINDTVYLDGDFSITVTDTQICDTLILYNVDKDQSLTIDNGHLTVTNGIYIAATVGGSKNAQLTLLNSGTLVSNGDIKIEGGMKEGKLKADNTSQVIINGNLILYANEDKAKVEVKSSAGIIINGSVTLNDASSQDAEFKIKDSATGTIRGDLIFIGMAQDNAKFKLEGSAQLNFEGNFNRSATGNYGELDVDDGTVFNFSGSSAQVMSMKAYGANTKKWKYGNVWINNPAGVTLDTNITTTSENLVQENISVQSGIFLSGGFGITLPNGKVFAVDSAAKYITTTSNATGGMLNTSTSATHSLHPNSTVQFSAAGNQNIPDIGSDYGNMVIDNSGSKIPLDDITIVGDLQIVKGSQIDNSINNTILFIKGDINQQGNMLYGTGTVVLNGSQNQTVDAFTDSLGFYNLDINNAGNKVILDAHVLISNQLDFPGPGYIKLNGKDLIINDWDNGDIPTLGTDRGIIADNSSSLIINGVDSNETASFPLTIGTGVANYARIDILNEDPSATGFAANLCNYVNHLGTCSGGNRELWKNIEYTWFVESASTDAEVTIYWHKSKENSLFNRSWTQINHHNGTAWEIIGIPGPASLLADSVFYYSAYTTSFSPLGGNSGGSALPIELLFFTGVKTYDSAFLEWTSLTETNNNFYTLERSNDAIEFEVLITLPGQGNSTEASYYHYKDDRPEIGINYYRLKQTDFDGTTKVLGMVSVMWYEHQSNYEVTIFPNPVSHDSFSVLAKGFSPSEQMDVYIFDIFGNMIIAKNVDCDKYGIMNQRFTTNLASGNYFILVEGNTKQASIANKFIVD